jgi:hypothetical protein
MAFELKLIPDRFAEPDTRPGLVLGSTRVHQRLKLGIPRRGFASAGVFVQP